MKRARDRLTITRPFAIFVCPDNVSDGIWNAHIVGHELDNMTCGDSPETAVNMAWDLICLLTDTCTGIDNKGGVHDYSIPHVVEDQRHGQRCSECGAWCCNEDLEDVLDSVPNQCMGCQAGWPFYDFSHLVVDGYPHERVACTRERYTPQVQGSLGGKHEKFRSAEDFRDHLPCEGCG